MLSSDAVINLKNQLSEKLVIKVEDADSNFIGELSLLQKGDEEKIKIVASLTKWRSRYMRFFLTQFDASSVRTKMWLNNVVTPAPDRLLFLIFDHEKKLIGNFGVANISENKCELDNLIRGERGGHPKLIFYSEISLLKWLFVEKGFKFVNLHVFANNSPTIKLHTSVGFTEVGRKKLFRFHNEKGEVIYKADEGAIEAESIQYVEMEMDSETFYRIHGH